MTTLEAVILGIVEGLTEFLPVSSTGHMILTQAALGVQETSFAKVFLVNIQFGAILAVLLMYFKRFVQSLEFYKSLIIAFIPAAILGYALNDFIDSLLQSVPVVALMLIIGGIIMIWADKYFDHLRHEKDEEIIEEEDANGNKHKRRKAPSIPNASQSFIIGFSQCVAMIPGVSRSAASIIGGLTQKMSFKEAAEYSFFLAVPTISVAALYKTYKGFDYVRGTDIFMLLVGNITSFVVAIIAINFFLRVLNKYGLKFFGYYRIILGVIILVGIYVFHLPFQIMK
jgi:undecaprenyl-diphosphatase